MARERPEIFREVINAHLEAGDVFLWTDETLHQACPGRGVGPTEPELMRAAVYVCMSPKSKATPAVPTPPPPCRPLCECLSLFSLSLFSLLCLSLLSLFFLSLLSLSQALRVQVLEERRLAVYHNTGAPRLSSRPIASHHVPSRPSSCTITPHPSQQSQSCLPQHQSCGGARCSLLWGLGGRRP